MATPTLHLENPVTQHRALILHRSPAVLHLRFWLPPHADGSPLHYHRTLREQFIVVEGTMTVELGSRGTRQTLSAGESLSIPPGQRHGFANCSAQWLVFDAFVQPAGQFADFIACLYGLAAAGQTNASGTPRSLLALLRLLPLGDVWLPGVPVYLQQLLFGAARWLSAHTALEAQLNAFRPNFPE
jgi:quercetin dioxygenase-like cupin family protein